MRYTSYENEHVFYTAEIMQIKMRQQLNMIEVYLTSKPVLDKQLKTAPLNTLYYNNSMS